MVSNLVIYGGVGVDPSSSGSCGGFVGPVEPPPGGGLVGSTSNTLNDFFITLNFEG